VVLELGERAGLSSGEFEDIVRRALRRLPSGDWTPSYIWENVVSDIRQCEWFKIYDIIEAIYAYFVERRPDAAREFEESINQYFRETGIGWMLTEGMIEVRGADSFEVTVRGAISSLEASGRPTARNELHEALLDLSRRPDPDITGAVQHAMAALECVARDVSGDPQLSLGQVVQRHSQLLPRPIDEVVQKLWGYASEMARHLREGRVVSFEEAVLMVELSAAVCNYLSNRNIQR